MREEISKILVKWSMPTRQVAISEIEALFAEIVKKSKPKGFKASDESMELAAQTMIDQYESNLTQNIEEGKK